MKSTILTMIDEMEDLEDKERKEYIKAFMKGGIDCDCMDIVMDNVVKEMPTYMDMIKSVVKEIDVDGSSDRVVRSERNYDRIEPKYPDYDRGDSYEYDRYEEKTEERSYDYKGKSEEGYGEERMDYYDYEMEAAPEEGAAEAEGDDE